MQMTMLEITTENSATLIMVAQEIMDAGQLWINLEGNDYYIPELIQEIKVWQENRSILD